jgi:hypothetical protein
MKRQTFEAKKAKQLRGAAVCERANGWEENAQKLEDEARLWEERDRKNK